MIFVPRKFVFFVAEKIVNYNSDVHAQLTKLARFMEIYIQI